MGLWLHEVQRWTEMRNEGKWGTQHGQSLSTPCVQLLQAKRTEAPFEITGARRCTKQGCCRVVHRAGVL